MINAAKNARRSVRFKADSMSIAYVDFGAPRGKFSPEASAIVVNESFKGCCLAVSSASVFAVGEVIRVKVGELDPVEAEVRWVSKLDSDVFKVGLLYLE